MSLEILTLSGVARLRADEDEKLTVYDDATGLPIVPGSHVIGHPTIGVGRALDVHGMSETETDMLLADDLASLNATLSHYSWFPTQPSPRRDVLIMMAFQMGIGGLLKFPVMLGDFAAENYAGAALAMLNSIWAQQTPERAKRLAQIMREGHY